MRYKPFLLSFIRILALLYIAGCAGQSPYLGMTRNEFLNATRWNLGMTLVQAQGNQTVYKDLYPRFYYFTDDKLVRIDQGVSAQKRYQYEVIQR